MSPQSDSRGGYDSTASLPRKGEVPRKGEGEGEGEGERAARLRTGLQVSTLVDVVVGADAGGAG